MVEELQGDRRELDNLRVEHERLKHSISEIISALQLQISHLNDPQLELQALRYELVQVRQHLGQARQDLQVRGESEKRLEDAAAVVMRETDAKERRNEELRKQVADLEADLDKLVAEQAEELVGINRRMTRCQNEHDNLVAKFREAEHASQQAMASRDAAITQRTQARRELSESKSHISSMRTTISRLEGKTNLLRQAALD
ncbi:hypothetical protein PHYBOEH_004426 [Phytophthora boehmeriae]|uniref:Uncharacterized protein n=1 Tax=Phytophthora boehmeriae TaxID=109152 RepID=A0A8T1WQW9_9STRA|nr:hypothetical protein PHYBOEH_004426 [Phytophthora boehmeriae]